MKWFQTVSARLGRDRRNILPWVPMWSNYGGHRMHHPVFDPLRVLHEGARPSSASGGGQVSGFCQLKPFLSNIFSNNNRPIG